MLKAGNGPGEKLGSKGDRIGQGRDREKSAQGTVSLLYRRVPTLPLCLTFSALAGVQMSPYEPGWDLLLPLQFGSLYFPGYIRLPRAVPTQLGILRVLRTPGSPTGGPTAGLMHSIRNTGERTAPES